MQPTILKSLILYLKKNPNEPSKRKIRAITQSKLNLESSKPESGLGNTRPSIKVSRLFFKLPAVSNYDFAKNMI